MENCGSLTDGRNSAQFAPNGAGRDVYDDCSRGSVSNRPSCSSPGADRCILDTIANGAARADRSEKARSEDRDGECDTVVARPAEVIVLSQYCAAIPDGQFWQA